jgi:hypothetical protein
MAHLPVRGKSLLKDEHGHTHVRQRSFSTVMASLIGPWLHPRNFRIGSFVDQ